MLRQGVVAPTVVLTLLAGCALSGCDSSPPKRPTVVQTDFPPVEPALRGLVGSEVQFRNVTPTLVSGYGIVVGLSGTGGLELNDAVASTMEREMALAGLSRNSEALKGTALFGKSPREILRDPNVAVVEVTAAVAPGAPAGSRYDVRVTALNASSLEGGRLWGTDLRLGPPSVFGGTQARKVGVARGPVYLNPFAEAQAGVGGVQVRAGRVLGGGEVTDSLDVVLTLNAPSHARARAIVSAINSRFPSGAGDANATARGRSDTTVELTIPSRYRNEPVTFLNLVRNIQIDQSSPEAYARRYVESIKQQPEMATELSWGLEALGERALPIIRDLYEYPELVPRLAGLKAGARLSDPRAATFLRDLATSGQGTVRTQALELLGEIDAGPRIDLALREGLSDSDMIVRIAAYEALAKRAERLRFSYLSRIQNEDPDLRRNKYSPGQLEEIARLSLPPNSLQGVSRDPIEGKFLLDRVDGGVPMIYVTQQQTPRIVVFGADQAVNVRGLVNMWDNTLLIANDEKPGMLKLRFERPDRPLLQQTVRATLPDLIIALARENNPADPRPGFDLTYSQIVATLSALQESGSIAATFATEQDRLNGALVAAQNARDMLERPETENDKEPIFIRRGPANPTTTTPTEDAKPTITPIGAAPAK
ncbi:MAG TPA: flagellar basal body P-ring protein FlgI [Phycisphaerales bacterium]|nr:flagellar basal body P-ring protein FlgI [Phycisphaerales bacterium]